MRNIFYIFPPQIKQRAVNFSEVVSKKVAGGRYLIHGTVKTLKFQI